MHKWCPHFWTSVLFALALQIFWVVCQSALFTWPSLCLLTHLPPNSSKSSKSVYLKWQVLTTSSSVSLCFLCWSNVLWDVHGMRHPEELVRHFWSLWDYKQTAMFTPKISDKISQQSTDNAHCLVYSCNVLHSCIWLKLFSKVTYSAFKL